LKLRLDELELPERLSTLIFNFLLAESLESSDEGSSSSCE